MTNPQATENKVNMKVFKKDVVSGMTLKTLGKKYGVHPVTIMRMIRNNGLPRRQWLALRRKKRQTEREKLLVMLNRELCKTPNLAEVCRRKKLNYFQVIQITGIRVHGVACYRAARNKCSMCGTALPLRPYSRRLCPSCDKIYKPGKSRRLVGLLPE